MNVKSWKYPDLGNPGKNLICLDKKEDEEGFDLSKFLNDDALKNKSFFKYKGSLTKPPCTENIEWFILENPT